MSRARPSPPFAIAAVAAAIVLSTSLVDYAADGDVGALNAARNWSWSHVLATLAFAAGAALAAREARRDWEWRRPSWRVASVLFSLLLVDNVTRLHTHTRLWPLFYGPILVGLAVAIWRLARDTNEAGVVAVGLLVLFVSVSFHVIGPYVVHALGKGDASWAYQIKASLKESTELAGWLLVVPGLWRLHRGRQAAPLDAHA